MGERLLDGLILATTLGCGTIGGVFFAFSAFVMAALARLPAPGGIAAMQSINIAVVNPAFMAVFLGTAAACLVLAVLAVMRWGEPGCGWLLAGAALYVFGSVALTIAFNVPLNDALAAVDPASADGQTLWASYVDRWTAWNHVRAIASAAAAGALAIAFRIAGQTP